MLWIPDNPAQRQVVLSNQWGGVGGGGAPAAPLQKNNKSELHVDRSGSDNQMTRNEFAMLNAALLRKRVRHLGTDARTGQSVPPAPDGNAGPHECGPECE